VPERFSQASERGVLKDEELISTTERLNPMMVVPGTAIMSSLVSVHEHVIEENESANTTAQFTKNGLYQ
jgi:hypothetical protein